MFKKFIVVTVPGYQVFACLLNDDSYWRKEKRLTCWTGVFSCLAPGDPPPHSPPGPSSPRSGVPTCARYGTNHSVVDPHWFHCGSVSSILGQCGFGSRVFDVRKSENFTDEKNPNFFEEKKLQFIYPILRPPRRTSKLYEKPSVPGENIAWHGIIR